MQTNIKKVKHLSPLRYPGGKYKLANFIASIIQENEIENGTYIEPYAGGASLAFYLLTRNYVSNIIINDYDRAIYAFWYSILNETNRFCNKIRYTRVTMRVWEKQKRIQANKKDIDLFQLGFSTFFLNRTNFSGIISGGPIGGYSQKGKWKLNARFNKERLIKTIRLLAKYKNNIKLYNLDAIKLIQTISPDLDSNTFIYFDPPYFIKGKDLYVNYYSYKDHLQVAEMINSLENTKWVISYDDVPEINNLYKNRPFLKYKLHYSASGSGEGNEVMFYNNLYVPDVKKSIDSIVI